MIHDTYSAPPYGLHVPQADGLGLEWFAEPYLQIFDILVDAKDVGHQYDGVRDIW